MMRLKEKGRQHDPEHMTNKEKTLQVVAYKIRNSTSSQ